MSALRARVVATGHQASTVPKVQVTALGNTEGRNEVSMFGFFDMVGNYEIRKVANDTIGDAEIDTCSVTDGALRYETGITHPDYNEGGWIIVEAYPTRDKAVAGHARWVKKMSAKRLPKVLTDCQNAGITKFMTSKELTFPRVPR